MSQTTEQIAAELAAAENATAVLRAKLAELRATERPAAIAQVLDLIAKHGLTRKECESAAWRKREYKARGPRKAKVAVAPTPAPQQAQQPRVSIAA